MICPYCCSISLKHYDSCLTCGTKFTAGNRAGGKQLSDSPIPFNQGLLDGGDRDSRFDRVLFQGEKML